MTGNRDAAQRDYAAEQAHAEWRGWMESRSYSTHPDDCEGMEEAFAAGVQAERARAAAARPAATALGRAFWPGYAARMGLAITYDEVGEKTRAALEDGLLAVAAHIANPDAEVTRLQRERDEAEDEVRELLRAWPRCPGGCSCRAGVEGEADRNECGCDGPCNGGDDGGGPTSQLHEGEWDDAVSEAAQ
jgi:hypothetical protein